MASYKEMQEAAKDLNTALSLDPPIKVVGSKAQMEEDLKEAGGLVKPTDKVAKETLSVLDDLGVKIVTSSKKRERIAETGKEDAPEKVTRITRAHVFKNLMVDGGGTKEDLVAGMIDVYGGSENEAEFQTTSFLRILTTMGFVAKDNETKVFTLA